MSLTQITPDSVNTYTSFTFNSNLVISGVGSLVVQDATAIYLGNGSSISFNSLAESVSSLTANTLYAIHVSANGSNGSAGQVLTSDGNVVFWSSDTIANSIVSNTITTSQLNSNYINIGVGTLTVGDSVTNSVVTNTSITTNNLIANYLSAGGYYGTDNQILVSNSIGGIFWSTPLAAGTNTQIIFNDEGLSGASPALTYDKYTQTLSVNNFISTGNASVNNITANELSVGNSSVYTIVNSSIVGVKGNGYYNPTFITPNADDPYWAFGTWSDNTTNFFMQTQFWGGNDTNHGFRVVDSNNGNIPFKIDGTGAVYINKLSANGSIGLDGQVLFSNGTSIYWGTGATGVTGYTGSQGDMGSTGYSGSQGDMGSTGYTGSQGDMGSTGYTGSQGDMGSTGYTGSQGDMGSTGYTGSQGDMGSTGYSGSQGDMGSTGYSGSQGDMGSTGYSGSQGDMGSTGYTGSQGDMGSTGYTGSRGTTGFTGSQGSTGYTGSEGPQGMYGYTGSLGYTGSQGNTGYTGSNGFTGSQGSTGYTGSNGFTGSQGVIGYTGSAGPVAGSDTQIVFNDGGYANGSSGLTYSKSTQTLTVGNNLYIGGNIYITGNVTTFAANNLDIVDNMIYLNSNSEFSNPDIGFAANYNDGIYHHAGFFRDHATGIWKVFENYLPEPQDSQYIDQSNNTFRIADFQANTLFANAINANGNIGTSGAFLVSNGTGMYWATESFSNTVTTNILTSNIVSSNNLTINNGISVGNSTVNTSINSTLIFSGNSTVNSHFSLSTIGVANSTSNSSISSQVIFAGNSAANASFNLIGGTNSFTATQYSIDSTGKVTISLSQPHNLSKTSGVYADISGTDQFYIDKTRALITSYPSPNVFTFSVKSADFGQALQIVAVSRSAGYSTYYTGAPHNLSAGETVSITNIPSSIGRGTFNVNNATIYDTPTSTTFRIYNAAYVSQTLSIEYSASHPNGGPVSPYNSSVSINLPYINSSAKNFLPTIYINGTYNFTPSVGSYVTISGVQGYYGGQPVNGNYWTIPGSGPLSLNGTYQITGLVISGGITRLQIGLVQNRRYAGWRTYYGGYFYLPYSGGSAGTVTVTGDVAYTQVTTAAFVTPPIITTTSTSNTTVVLDNPIFVEVSNSYSSATVTPTSIFVGGVGANNVVIDADGTRFNKKGSILQTFVDGTGFNVTSLLEADGSVDPNAAQFHANSSVLSIGNSTSISTFTQNNITSSTFVAGDSDSSVTLNTNGISLYDLNSDPANSATFSTITPSYAYFKNLLSTDTLDTSAISANGDLGNAGDILFSNGAGVYWSNTALLSSIETANLIIDGTLSVNGSIGSAGQFLVSNGIGLYWTSEQISNTITANTLSADFIAIGKGDIRVGNNVSNTALSNTNLKISTSTANTTYSIGITANSSLGSYGQVLTSNGTGIFWANATVNGAITASTLNADSLKIGIGDIVVGSSSTNTNITNTSISIGGNNLKLFTDTNNRLQMQNGSAGYVQFYDVKDPDNGIYNYTFNMDSGKFHFAMSTTNSAFDYGSDKFWIDYNSNIGILGNIYANNSYGTAGQVLASDGTKVYWTSANNTLSGAVTVSTLQADSLAIGIGDIRVGNASLISTNITNTAISIGNTTVNTYISQTYVRTPNLNVSSVYANSSYGSSGQVLTSNGTGVFWSNSNISGAITVSTLQADSLAIGIGDIRVGNASLISTNITNTAIFVGNTTVNSSLNSTSLAVKSIYANSSVGTAGQILTSNGSGVYWSTAVGYTGSQGTVGYTGSAGTNGTVGYTGSQGVGYTGSQGTVGYAGSQGSLGYTGSQGVGYTGSQGVGYTGSQGNLGYTGSQGSLGYAGSIGFTGSSGAYAAVGYTGSAGVNGYSGSYGFTGSIGFTGSAGGYSTANATSYSFYGDGSTNTFSIGSFVNSQNNIIVTLNGLVQVPVKHYTITGTNLSFTSPPLANNLVEVRNFEYGTGGYTGVTAIYSGNTVIGATANGLSYNTGSFAAQGDSIVRQFVLRSTSNSASESELLIDNTYRIAISSNTTVYYTADIVGLGRYSNGSAGTFRSAFQLKGVVDNYQGNTEDVGNLYELIVARDVQAWSVDARANNVSDTLNIFAGNTVGYNVRWVAYVTTIEVTQ